jgi:myo-inositol-1(or 4)-monophosphatase
VDDLSRATRAAIADGRKVVEVALDELAPRLLAASGEVDVAAKGDGTPVTDADHEADAFLSATLLDAFPDHGVLSEERTTVAPDTEWTWIVDPIDGTSNFTCRLPYWCVSVALAYQGTPVLGIVDAPVLGRRYLAEHGQGAYRDTRRLQVRPRVDWRDGRNRHIPVMLSTGTARRARAAGLRLNPRIMGSLALDLAAVAEGSAAYSVALIPKVWDVAAGWLLVREAGGAMVTVRDEPLLPVTPGVPYGGRTAVTAAGADHDDVLGLARSLLPDGA